MCHENDVIRELPFKVILHVCRLLVSKLRLLLKVSWTYGMNDYVLYITQSRAHKRTGKKKCRYSSKVYQGSLYFHPLIHKNHKGSKTQQQQRTPLSMLNGDTRTTVL